MTEEIKIPRPAVLKAADVAPKKQRKPRKKRIGESAKQIDLAPEGNFMTRGVHSVQHNGTDPKAEPFIVARDHVPTPPQTKPFSRACSADDQTTKHNYGTLTPLN